MSDSSDIAGCVRGCSSDGTADDVPQTMACAAWSSPPLAHSLALPPRTSSAPLLAPRIAWRSWCRKTLGGETQSALWHVLSEGPLSQQIDESIRGMLCQMHTEQVQAGLQGGQQAVAPASWVAENRL